MRDLKQILVIRRDLNMRRGKEIVQGSHASQLARDEAKKVLTQEEWDHWNVYWGMKKVSLQVKTLEELVAVFEAAKAAGLPCAMVVDEGLTEFNGVKTATAVGIGPYFDDAIDPVTGELKLY